MSLPSEVTSPVARAGPAEPGARLLRRMRGSFNHCIDRFMIGIFAQCGQAVFDKSLALKHVITNT